MSLMLDLPLEENVPLAEHNWFKLGGPARYFARPRSAEQLQEAFAFANDEGLAVKMLGKGANIIVPDEGFSGLVIQLSGDLAGWRRLDETDLLIAGAGADLQRMIQPCVRDGMAGLETLVGIPATVGGAIRMNAGGRFGEIGPLVHRVRILHDGAALSWHSADECVFSYRHSELPDDPGAVIVEAELQLAKQDPVELQERYKMCRDYKKASQPAMGALSAGCIFKNPTVGGQRTSAGKLIDEAGLKGVNVGSAKVSEQHGNFIVTDPSNGATAGDVLRLIARVRERVLSVHGVELELEVDVWR